MEIKPILLKALTSFVGFVIFILIVIILNVLNVFIANHFLNTLVDFLNNNLYIILLISIFFFFGEIFNLMGFPLNLPAPLFNAVGAIFVVMFLFGIFDLITTLSNGAVVINLNAFRTIAYIVVFAIVVIVGYLSILTGMLDRPSLSKTSHARRVRRR
jgi:hypothetical protein